MGDGIEDVGHVPFDLCAGRRGNHRPAIKESLLTWVRQHPRLKSALLSCLNAYVEGRERVMSACELIQVVWLLLRETAAWRGRRAVVRNATTSLRIAQIVVSDVHRDPRVRKSAQALVDAGHDVVVIYPRLSPTDTRPHPADWDSRLQFEATPFARSFFRFPGLYHGSLYRAVAAGCYDVLHCNDLNTAIVGFRAARSTQSSVVLDYHEWWSEGAVYDAALKRFRPHSWFARMVYRATEAFATRHASSVITVCDSIACALRARHGIEVEVVRNLPELPTDEIANPTTVLNKVGRGRRLLLLYQGGVGPSRNLEPVIEALGLVPEAELVIRGPGLETVEQAYRPLPRARERERAIGCATCKRCRWRLRTACNWRKGRFF